MKYRNLVLIGTSHIAPESLSTIEATFKTINPGIVAVELDGARLDALLSGKRAKPTFSDIRRIGIKGFLFAQLGSWAERKLGETVGVAPGDDMLKAVRLASSQGLPVALIDQNIDVTLREFSKHLTWTEKWRFLVDVLKAIFGPKQNAPFDLRTIPSQRVVKKLTTQVRKRYPNVYKVLVADRNTHMARKLAAIMTIEHDKTIMAVVGAGHEGEIITIIKETMKKTTKKKNLNRE